MEKENQRASYQNLCQRLTPSANSKRDRLLCAGLGRKNTSCGRVHMHRSLDPPLTFGTSAPPSAALGVKRVNPIYRVPNHVRFPPALPRYYDPCPVSLWLFLSSRVRQILVELHANQSHLGFPIRQSSPRRTVLVRTPLRYLSYYGRPLLPSQLFKCRRTHSTTMARIVA